MMLSAEVAGAGAAAHWTKHEWAGAGLLQDGGEPEDEREGARSELLRQVAPNSVGNEAGRNRDLRRLRGRHVQHGAAGASTMVCAAVDGLLDEVAVLALLDNNNNKRKRNRLR